MKPEDVPDSLSPLAPRLSGPPVAGGLPHIGEVIERIGFGRAQVLATCVGGGIYLADGAELLLISSVARTVGDEWRMTPMQRGLIVTIVFCGVFLGNLASGPLGDNYGRRLVIILSFAGIFVFSISSALSTSLAMLSAVRLLVGISIGMGQPTWNSLGLELTPTDYRATMIGVCMSLFGIGEAYSALLLMADDPSLNALRWRWLLMMGSIPSAVFFFGSLAFLYQSPSFLALRGQRDEAMAVLASMRDSNGAGDFSVEFQEIQQPQTRDEQETPWLRRYSLVFNEQFGATTLVMMYTCFTLNFCYFGSLYAFPQILQNLDMGCTPAMQLLLGGLVQTPGCYVGIALATVMPRKVMMKFVLTFVIGAVCSFILGIQHLHLWLGWFMALAGFFGLKFFLPCIFTVVYVYTGEVFPAEIRNTGTSVCLSAGRFGPIIAPVAYEVITSLASKGGPQAFLMVMLGLLMTNAAVLDLLHYETFGKQLKVTVFTGAQGDGMKSA